MRFFRPAVVYILVTLAILLWWGWAFHASIPQSKPLPLPAPYPQTSLSSFPLSRLNREILQKALAGDFALMGRLMAEWDLDAAILAAQDIRVQRFEPNISLQAQALVRKIRKKTRTNGKFLPQTYASAGILLAIAHPDQIAALPSGLRAQAQLYPETLTQQIPLDTHRFNSEALFLARPDLAFVSAQYSHPATIANLRNQGIRLHFTGSQESFRDIQKNIHEIGTACGLDEEAEMLSLFLESALMAIDNRLALLSKNASPSLVYLSFHTQFTTLQPATVIADLLRRLGVRNLLEKGSVVLSEQLAVLNPDRIIISATNIPELKRGIGQDPAFLSLKALQHGNLYFVDDTVQQTITQHVLLAYYDLAKTLAGDSLQ